MEIAAEGQIDAPPEAVFAFLSDLDKHWLLSDRSIEVVSLDVRRGIPRGGIVRLRGPLALHRTVTTRLLSVSPPYQLEGTAEVGRGTRAVVRWTVARRGTGTAVRLSASVVKLSLPDRLLLAAGGASWLRTRFAATIDRLALHLDTPATAPRPEAIRLAVPGAAVRPRLAPGARPG